MLALALTAFMATTPSTSVGVGLTEFGLASYRDRAPQGQVRFNVTNRGEDPHDFAVRNAAGKVVAQLARLGPGDHARLKVTLRTRGAYTLFCTLPGHEAKGMHARFKIVRAKRPRTR